MRILNTEKLQLAENTKKLKKFKKVIEKTDFFKKPSQTDLNRFLF